MTRSVLKNKTVDAVHLEQLIRTHSLEDEDEALEHLIRRIGDAKYVMLGEASHGTHEYYTWRARISRRLIEEKGFSFIAVEGDWPDCYRVNRYVKNYSDTAHDVREIFKSFNRWPTWMWANWETIALAEWLHGHNEGLSADKKIGFYGLDVYSLWESLEAIIGYLDRTDPKTKNIAMRALSCFEPYGEEEGQAYARASLMVPQLCEREVVDLLLHIRKNVGTYDHDPEGAMNAEQNAHVVVNAEQYYRAMIRPGPHAWNLRDEHMMHTLERLMKFHGDDAKVIIWEHNTHIGDARATDMSREKMINLGQLLHEKHESDGVYAVGFGSYQGKVIAASEWGAPMQEMDVREARGGSWEDVLHKMDAKDRLIFLDGEIRKELSDTVFPHRAIGVVYRPALELFGNYVPTILPKRYDAFIYIDDTSALHPLYLHADRSETPETFPFGM